MEGTSIENMMDDFEKIKSEAGVELDRGDFVAALEKLKSAYEVDPGDPEILFNMAIAAVRLGHLDDALGIIAELLGLGSGFTDIIRVYQMELYILLELKKYDIAGERFADVMGRFPENVPLLSLYGFMLEQTEKLTDAKTVFEKVLMLDPDNTNATNSLAYIKAKLGEDLDGALGQQAKLIKEFPNHPAYLDTFGTILKGKGLIPQAKAAFEKGIKKSGGHPVIQEHLDSLKDKD